jgi:preprotein translocase subunit SecG
VFGATGSANFLSRATAIAAGAFFVTTLMLAFVINGQSRSSNSVMNSAPAITAPAVPTVPTDAVKAPVTTAPSDAVPAIPSKPAEAPKK